MRNSRQIRILVKILYMLTIVIGICLLINRVRFGVELTDEAWYVAEPYIVSQGAVPYVNNWTQAPGFSLPLAFFFKIYVLVNGTEGIFLFSRILYVCWLVFVSFVSVYILGKNTPGITPYLTVFPLLFTCAQVNSMFDINYNTIGVIYLLPVLVLMIFVQEKQSKMKYGISLLIAGLIMARTIIGTPYTLLAWFILLVYCVKTKQWKKLCLFIAGNAVMAVIVVGGCCIGGGGIWNFINGMRAWLNDAAYFKIPAQHTRVGDVLYLISFCKPLLICFIVTLILRIIRPWHDRLFYGFLIAFILYGLCNAFLAPIDGYSAGRIVKYLWFIPFIILFCGKLEEEKRLLAINICILNAIYFVVYLFASACNIYGFSGREYWLYIPSIFSILLMYYVMHNKIVAYCGLYIGLLVLGALLIRYAYSNVYRDQEINLLDTKVDYGVYKGCYTTVERAESVKELEQYIRSVTEADDNVLFLDWASFGYVMTEANACTPTALDPMSYSYGVNDPKVMYDYFALSGRVPNKIIYIDHGRDEFLSIDNEWRFNEFVNDYYILKDVFMTTNAIENRRYEVSYPLKASFLVKYYEIVDEETNM